ncbi:MAG: substrate-binding domain-containing protein [Limisphaerales bacterium]
MHADTCAPSATPCPSTANGHRAPVRHPLCAALFAVALAAGLAGCGKAPPAGNAGAKRLHLAFVANSPGEYWAIVNLGCDIAAQQLGEVDLSFRYPSATTIEDQQRIVNSLLAAGVDGIAISPIDPEKQTEFLNEVAAKTLLVCADSDAPKSKRVSYIGTDNVAAGAEAATLLKAALPGGGRVALFVGYANAQNTRDRVAGIRAGLAGSNLQLVETFEDGQKSALVGENLTKALSRHPDLAGVMGVAGYHGPALRKALRDAGRTGQVKIVCFDDNSDTLEGIGAGEIHGTIAQKPFQVGKETIVHMRDRLRGNNLARGQVFIPFRALTGENVAHHIAQQQGIANFLKESSLRP